MGYDFIYIYIIYLICTNILYLNLNYLIKDFAAHF